MGPAAAPLDTLARACGAATLRSQGEECHAAARVCACQLGRATWCLWLLVVKYMHGKAWGMQAEAPRTDSACPTAGALYRHLGCGLRGWLGCAGQTRSGQARTRSMHVQQHAVSSTCGLSHTVLS